MIVQHIRIGLYQEVTSWSIHARSCTIDVILTGILETESVDRPLSLLRGSLIILFILGHGRQSVKFKASTDHVCSWITVAEFGA